MGIVERIQQKRRPSKISTKIYYDIIDNRVNIKVLEGYKTTPYIRELIDKVKIVKTILREKRSIDVLSRENPKLFYWIEEIVCSCYGGDLDKTELLKRMVILINHLSPMRAMTSEDTTRVIEGYLKNEVIILNSNETAIKSMIEQEKKEEIKASLEKLKNNDISIDDMSLSDLEASSIKAKTKYTIGLYGALNKMLDGTDPEELKGYGAFGTLLADSMKSVMESKNTYQKINFIKTLVSAVPANTNILQYMQVAGNKQDEQVNKTDKKITDLLNKIKTAN